jgi:anaerobic ribonucleoside-triphosphate reductase activating protein
MHWQLNRIQYPVYNLGKGERIGIWVQGCSLGCKGCISQTLQTKEGGQLIDIEALVTEITKVKDQFDGITITGGEPFQQYKELIAFCAYLKQLTNLEIYVFSGYYLNELVELFPDQLFTKYIDFLMDGRYLKEEHHNENSKGSANQTLYQFINNEAIKIKNGFSSNEFGLSINKDNRVYLSGIPKQNDLNRLKKYLTQTGIDITFK